MRTLSAVPRVCSAALHVLFGFGPCCRFVPSCSEYCRDALSQHGVTKGSWLFVRRLARCHPWGAEGWDPVPARKGVSNGRQ